ncbi:MAG: pyridoxal-dependent decarboxylase [Monoraphidium minutum]|nr:MAG: pyridoxal-dependent decarboxylase [Monoraphidium minutum]
MAPPADVTMGPCAAAAFGAAAASPFQDYAFCAPLPGPAPPLGCCAAACAAPRSDSGSDGSAASGACSMDTDGGADAAARALDALLAAATCKPAASDDGGCGALFAAPAALATPVLPPAARAVLGVYGAASVAAGEPAGVRAAAARLISRWGLADTFYVYDFGEVARLHGLWVAALPRVAPFYAVKCNPEPGLVAMLDALGAGFDCASIQELERAAAHGVPQSRVIFANPCKRPADFRYAAEKGVEYTTFDCASELEKIAAGYPAFKCVLRIRCDDETCKINLGLKYGADPDADVPGLLAHARRLGLQVVGVSFHVGSGCQNVSVYADAIRRARGAFDAAAAMGYGDMHLLDVGGGFTAPYDPSSADLFYRTAAVINGAIHEHFPPGCGVRIIAEPGRYFAETSATLFTTILGQRAPGAPPRPPSVGAGAPAVPPPPPGPRDYWLSDSTWGSFRIQVAVDGLEPAYAVLRSPLLPPPGPELDAPGACRLWGDSGRDGDCVHGGATLPRLRDGDWLAFDYAGAYTICSASRFAGGRASEPTKMFICSSGAARDLGRYNDPAVRAAAAAGAPPAPPAAAYAPGLCAAARVASAAAAAAEMLQALSVDCGAGCVVGVGGARAGACCGGGDDAMSGSSSESEGGAEPGRGRCRGADDGGAPPARGDAPMGGCDEAAASVRRGP